MQAPRAKGTRRTAPQTKQARYRRRKLEAGLCPRCSKPAAPYHLCPECREYRRHVDRVKYHQQHGRSFYRGLMHRICPSGSRKIDLKLLLESLLSGEAGDDEIRLVLLELGRGRRIT